MQRVQPTTGRPLKLRCSFCGVGAGQGRRFLSASKVQICDDCVRQAHSLLELPDGDDRQLSVGFDDPTR